MIDPYVGPAAKIFSAVFGPTYSYVKKRWFRPSLETQKAPQNIFEHLQPSTSKDRIKEVFGSPHRVSDDTWCYRFKDAMVQVEFWDSGAAKSVALALTSYSPKAGFPIPMIDQPLGQLTLEDVMCNQGNFEFRSSLRTEEVLWKTRIGAPGAWFNYTFGALSPLTPGYLAGVSFQWDYESEQLITHPAGVKINWIAISDSMDEVWFDWALGLPDIV
jgi:hypothetical protein